MIANVKEINNNNSNNNNNNNNNNNKYRYQVAFVAARFTYSNSLNFPA